MRRFVVLVFVVLLTVPSVWAGTSRRYGSRNMSRSAGHVSRSRSVGSHTRSPSRKCTTCVRDEHGRIKRDPAARREFRRQNPCPATGKTYGACPGYVVDHIVPLKRGGADWPENMQWQTRAEAGAKDRVE